MRYPWSLVKKIYSACSKRSNAGSFQPQKTADLSLFASTHATSSCLSICRCVRMTALSATRLSFGRLSCLCTQSNLWPASEELSRSARSLELWKNFGRPTFGILLRWRCLLTKQKQSWYFLRRFEARPEPSIRHYELFSIF